MELSKYNKLWVSLAAPLGALIFAMAPTDLEAAFVVTVGEWYMILVASASSVGVYTVPNKK